uniref:Uncharacterized protein n=1 Tax=Cacopsylla melanoneura TaxID=428564 RepID=A0A8D8UKJ5_9HEMI
MAAIKFNGKNPIFWKIHHFANVEPFFYFFFFSFPRPPPPPSPPPPPPPSPPPPPPPPTPPPPPPPTPPPPPPPVFFFFFFFVKIFIVNNFIIFVLFKIHSCQYYIISDRSILIFRPSQPLKLQFHDLPNCHGHQNLSIVIGCN